MGSRQWLRNQITSQIQVCMAQKQVYDAISEYFEALLLSRAPGQHSGASFCHLRVFQPNRVPCTPGDTTRHVI